MVFGAVAAVVVANDWDEALVAVLGCSAVLGAVGLVDDRQGLPPLVRLAAQVLTPAVGVLLVAPRQGVALVAATLIAVIGVAGYVNAFNFMDGINGISGSQAAIAGGALSIVALDLHDHPMQVAALAVCGAAIGFLPFNAVHARIFLGDVGSYFLGCWLAAVALVEVDGGAPVLVVLGPFLLYLLDTGTVLVRRARRGASLLEAHREHTYQRLTQLGYSHVAVAALCAGFTSICAGAMLLMLDRSIGAQSAMFAGCLCVVAAYLALPSFLARTSTRRSEPAR